MSIFKAIQRALAHRKTRKAVKQLLHEARHARHMREDVAPQSALESLRAAEDELRQAWRGGHDSEVEAAANKLADATAKVYPPPASPRMTEFVEILAVALVVAWGLRTYFVQPFKIPTGSMQPTLFGITYEPQVGRGALDIFPLDIVRYVLFGERYVEVKAKVSGRVNGIRVNEKEQAFYLDVGGVLHRLPGPNLFREVNPGDYVVKGQVLASGLKKAGDHIFVDKVRYNFVRPSRGDVFVFSTRGIDHRKIKKNQYYIKRIGGIPGDDISIDPPYLLNHGQRVLEPWGFRRVAEDREDGYQGYFLAFSKSDALIKTREDHIQLGPDEYLPLGDNSARSLDGRYFGPVHQKFIVGPAFLVYWPFTKRWGHIQ